MFYLDANKTKPLETIHVPTLPSKTRIRTSHKVTFDGKQYRVHARSMARNADHYILVNRKEVQLY